MLTFAEELLLIALDDEKGIIIDLPVLSLEYSLAGAILMELALKNRIDSDLEKLMLIDDSPTGDEVFDKVIDIIRQFPESKSAKHWIIEITRQFENLPHLILEKLINKGILRKEEHKILWVFRKRRYPMINDTEEKEVKTRIRELILSDEIPDPRDVVLISLIKSCGLIDEIFSKDEQQQTLSRIEQIAKMDLIGLALSNAVQEIQKLISSAVAYVTVGMPA